MTMLRGFLSCDSTIGAFEPALNNLARAGFAKGPAKLVLHRLLALRPAAAPSIAFGNIRWRLALSAAQRSEKRERSPAWAGQGRRPVGL
jgi:hypothetical protein